jgi:4-hydroxybenzoate polyprenyltransferase
VADVENAFLIEIAHARRIPDDCNKRSSSRTAASVEVSAVSIRRSGCSKPWLYVFYSLAFALMIAGGLAAGLRIVFVLSMLVAGAHLLWQLRSLDIDRPLRCLMLFKSNRDTGALIAAALILGSVFGV